MSRLHEQVSKGVGNATRYVVYRVPLLVCVGLGIVHLRCMRDARALCIALRSLGRALCMWLAHMFGRSMRGSHVETETCTSEARACCFCVTVLRTRREKRKDPGIRFSSEGRF